MSGTSKNTARSNTRFAVDDLDVLVQARGRRVERPMLSAKRSKGLVRKPPADRADVVQHLAEHRVIEPVAIELLMKIWLTADRQATAAASAK
jgi:hypothetical protein